MLEHVQSGQLETMLSFNSIYLAVVCHLEDAGSRKAIILLSLLFERLDICSRLGGKSEEKKVNEAQNVSKSLMPLKAWDYEHISI